nr:midasin [Nomia melanderi]XP_031828783.1 midasin [Nomia melanderi]
MLLKSVAVFAERKKIYAQKFAAYKNVKELNKHDREKILNILCDFLMNSKCTDDVAECFPQLLPALVSTSIPLEKVSFSDGDVFHKLNCVILGKLISKNRDLLTFVLHYFDVNLAPFESLEDDYTPSSKKHNRRRASSIPEISDYDLIKSCYDILCSAPMHFQHIWNWSKFYKYLTAEDEAVKWVATNCIVIVLEMSESSSVNHLINLFPKSHELFLLHRKVSQNNITSVDTDEIDELFSDLKPVVPIGGVLLPVFNKLKSNKETNLIPVPSTRRNLQNVAFAVSSNKCVCLEGVVGSGKTALVDFLAEATGHDAKNFVKVQLGDQTDSRMLLGMYLCTDIPGEFLWQPGILTEAVLSGKWLLLEDIDCAPTDVLSVIGQLVENKTLSVPGYRDCIRVKSGFQLFVTVRLAAEGARRSLKMPIPYQKDWVSVYVEPLSKEELVTVVQVLYPVLQTVATRMIDVFLLFSVDNHEDDAINSIRNARQISTRDLIKWCSRAVVDFDVSSPVSALKIFQDALDVFCCSVSNCAQRLNLAIAVANKLGIIKTKAEYFCNVHKPSVNIYKQSLTVGRAKLDIKRSESVKLANKGSNFSYTRPSVCLLERIASCVAQKEPVLLVGETGTGKTSCIQYLAQITGSKLTVINMNQQSESTDLLGGYKPIDFKLLMLPIREEFEVLFRSYFAIEPNKKFLTHIGHCFEEKKWKTLSTLMTHSTAAALKRLRASPTNQDTLKMLKKWEIMAQKLEKLQSQVQSNYSLAFSFVEGGLVKALKNGDWVLLDEINLAAAETLDCLSGLLEHSGGSLSLLERGDKEPIKRHPDFAIFACMNPATDVGKKDLPVGLRNRFTEFFVDELTEKSDLQLLVTSYLKDLNLPNEKIDNIVKFYLNIRKEAETNLLDGIGHKPHYSLRTLCRALSISSQNPCGNALRSLYEAFCLSFLTQLDSQSYPLVLKMIVKAILGNKTASALLGTPIPRPHSVVSDSYINFAGYWIHKGDLNPEISESYVLTETVRQNLKDLLRVVSIGKMPVLLQGDTSVGKTSLITYLAKASGHICVRINNHEHTDLQEYVGTYIADSTGKLVFKEGILVDAMRKGYWIILDELNLAPSDVLEALNRVLDDNRELYIPETQQVVKANENFMLFATQNPPGLYGGRKALSRAFRNRFVELHFAEIPPVELEEILRKRCRMPETYSKQVIGVMTELQVRRKSTATFAGKKGFMTLRDLFRWGERYRLAPAHEGVLYDWSQHLADEGYLVLSSKVRYAEEHSEIIQAIKKHLKRDVDPESLFVDSEKTSPVTKEIVKSLYGSSVQEFEHVVPTYPMIKMAVLLTKACEFKEPVLLIGETGCGKTTVCQMLARFRNQELSTINCHMHTEASDFLGSLRPVREHKDNQKLFEWVDGPLVQAMKEGGFFLADEISLADDSVLERLNSLLEPERKLLIAEKSSDDEDATITAHEDFIFVGTMNPGGDYGKKELSPALRNRFTEIWCGGCPSPKDLDLIMQQNLHFEVQDCSGIKSGILEFLEWLKKTEIGKKLVVSIRDVMTWVTFINCCVDAKMEEAFAFYHGAAVTFIDGLGSGATANENPAKLKEFKDSATEFIKRRAWDISKTELDFSCEQAEIETNECNFGISSFYVTKSYMPIPDNIGFTFTSPTIKMNTLKVLRAAYLNKPILLEGSPGVGKTGLIYAIAVASGHRILRINLSDQTDISDLFGADLPVEGGRPGEFSWRDGVFLRAMRNGDWILLDELNLASQSVLEGLNACFDHRGEVYIPELTMNFQVNQNTRFFACQNPLRQGGARRGLPKSFLNRFTQVFIDAPNQEDLLIILKSQFPQFPELLLTKMITFNEKVSSEAGVTWAHSGSPWEMNIRDLVRWCQITLEARTPTAVVLDPARGARLLYIDRMRTEQDRAKVIEIFNEVFPLEYFPLPDSEYSVCFIRERVFAGLYDVLCRTQSMVLGEDDLLLLRSQKNVFRSLVQCVHMNWISILIGDTGSGKTSLVHLLASVAGQKLKTIVVNSATDTMELLGGFEQTDYDRHFEELLDRTETLLIEILRRMLLEGCLDQVSYYHALLENVRHLSKDDGRTKETTMSTETELFLRKTEELSKLVSVMKMLSREREAELQQIKQKLADLLVAVKKEKCLNAGGKFEWVDSVLVKCLQNGTWLLLDQVNLCSPAVLDRLNGLLEPNGILAISEKGVDEHGNAFAIKPHPNFRLFFTMNPRYGEISRAMRNRGVEIVILPASSLQEYNALDIRSLLAKCGVRRATQQSALMKVHDYLHDKQFRLDELLRAASFTNQQVTKGFTFEESVRNSYREVLATLDPRSKREAMGKVEEILSSFNREDRSVDDLYDFDAISPATSDLCRNSALAFVDQQVFLLRTAVKMLRYDPAKIHFDLFEKPPVTDTKEFVKLLLLDFYGRSSFTDKEFRRARCSSIFGKNDSDSFGKLAEVLYKRVNELNIFFHKNASLEFSLGWHQNNLMLALYFSAMTFDCESRVIQRDDNIMLLMDYSLAATKGDLTSNLLDNYIIVNFVKILENSADVINCSLHNPNLYITSLNYVVLRDLLKWYRRFYDLGTIPLVDKTQGTFFDLREITSQLEIHYEWLSELFDKLTSVLEASPSDPRDPQQWNDSLDQYFNSTTDVNKRHSIQDNIRTFLPAPQPHFTEETMRFHEKLRSTSRMLEVTDEDLIELSKTRLKIASLALPENRRARGKLIEILAESFRDDRAIENSEELENIAAEIVTLKEIGAKEVNRLKDCWEIEIWPIYEFFFMTYALYFQKKLSKQLVSECSQGNDGDDGLVIWEELNGGSCDEDIDGDYDKRILEKFETVPTIPVRLIGLMKSLNSEELPKKRRICLLFEFSALLEDFSLRTAASGNCDAFLQLFDQKEKKDKEDANEDINKDTSEDMNKDKDSNVDCEMNCFNTWTLWKLISELLPLHSGTKAQTINLRNHVNKKKLWSAVRTMVWRNSKVFGSKEFDPHLNDRVTFLSTANYCMSCIRRAMKDYKPVPNNDKEQTVKSQLDGLLELLQEAVTSLKSSDDKLMRCKGWIILGQLQLFVFKNVGAIDPVQRMALMSKYTRENITELEHLMLIENLQRTVLGVRLLQHQELAIVNHLQRLSKEMKNFEGFQAARPTSGFLDLKEEIQRFSNIVASDSAISQHVKSMEATYQDTEGDVLEKGATLEKVKVWRKSVRRFWQKLERKFLTGFPDLVLPIISAVSNLHHGVSLLLQCENSHNSPCDSSVNRYLSFPLTMSLDNHYISEICDAFIGDRYDKIAEDDRQFNLQYRVVLVALRELENWSTVARAYNGHMSDDEYAPIFDKLCIAWYTARCVTGISLTEKSWYVVKEDEKEAERKEEEEYRSLFPSYQQDFLELGAPASQKPSEASIKIDDCVEVPHKLEQEAVRSIQTMFDNWDSVNFSYLEALTSRSRNSKEPQHLERSETDFVSPLVQRFQLFSEGVGTGQTNWRTPLISSMSVLMSTKSDSRVGRKDVYDFYRDPNVSEAEECYPYLERLTERVDSFLEEWPENPLLYSVKQIIERLLGFPIDSSLLRFLVGFELLLNKIQQWEENARSDVSLAEFIEFLGRKILYWRKLELSRWKDSLEILEDDLRAESSKWWFLMYRWLSVISTAECPFSEFINNREYYTTMFTELLTKSPLIQFEPRLRLLYTLYQYSHMAHPCEVSHMLWNIYHRYRPFLNGVRNKIKSMKEPIARKVRDTVKITRWNDVSYWSVKNTAEKTRRTLHKLAKEYRKCLQEHVAAHLTVPTGPESLDSFVSRDLGPADFLVQLGTGELRKGEKLALKARQFCEDIFSKRGYSQIRHDIEAFIEDSLEESKKLRSLQVDKTLTKEKQRSQAKSILQQKKLALSNYFKSLNKLGLSYRAGDLAWRCETYDDVELASLLEPKNMWYLALDKDLYGNIDRGFVEQASDAEKYYFESLIKFGFLDSILKSGKSDIGTRNMERLRGYSVHLIVLANEQKRMISEFLYQSLINLKSEMWSVHKYVETWRKSDTLYITERDVNDMESLNVQNFLQWLELTMKQIVVYLESCPSEPVDEESLLDMNKGARPVSRQSAVDSAVLVKDALKVVASLSQEFYECFEVALRRSYGLSLLMQRENVDFLRTCFRKINEVKEKMVSLNSVFTEDHPVACHVRCIVENITSKTKCFESLMDLLMKNKDDVYTYIINQEEYQLKKLVDSLLLGIQKQLRRSTRATNKGRKDVEEESEEESEKNLLTGRLVRSLIWDLRCIKVDCQKVNISKLMIHRSITFWKRTLPQHLPLLQQFSLLVHYYMYELIASYRLTCKLLYLQLNVFLELAKNGFCQPEDAPDAEESQDGGPSEGGMGLADGEGTKDVSDRIESEDQLEDTIGPNEEKQESEKKDCKEEDKGIEMSENFDSHQQDLNPDEQEESDEDGTDDLDKEMGKLDYPDKTVDEELWKDDEEEEKEEDQEEKNEEKKGNGEETGEQEMGGKDGAEDKDKNEDGEREQEGGMKEEEKKEIDEFKEPEVNDDQIDPYHGKQQPEIEPEAFNLPEDINLDDETKEDKDNEDQEENPFDIDQIKESKAPEEKEPEESKEDGQEEDEHRNDDTDEDGTDAEEDPRADTDKKDETEASKEDKDNDVPEESMEEDKQPEEEKVSASLDASSKEMDASQEVESRKDGSRDAVESQSDDKNMETESTEISADDKKDKGTGQAQTEQRQGHSGGKKEENAPTSGEEKSSKPIEKRRKPGQSDENRSLLDDETQPSAKKLKTGLMRDEPDDQAEKENDADNGGASETYEHIKKSEAFDEVVFDAATEEQTKQQASNIEDEQMDDQPDDVDIKLYEDPTPEEEEEKKVEKERSSKVHDSEKEKSSRGKGERSDVTEETEATEVTGEVEGEIVETSRVLRGSESTFHTNLPEPESLSISTEDIAKKRSEIVDMLVQWSRQSSSVEAANAWSSISTLTESAARELSEKLRLVLEPTLTTRLKGDYRTGKRINMRKVIPYIASEFRKDKIWLRRTKPSKRDYQIVLAIDDSSSMADNHSKELAFESLSLIGKALTYLEVGQFSVVSFGEQVNIIHPFGENFTEESGARLIQEMKFEQKKTMIGQLLDYAIDMLSSQSSSTDSAKLITILSDGRGIFSEGVEKVNAAVRRAKLLNIFLVFIIVDNPLNKNSILDIRMPVFESGKLLGIRSYMDNFPFPFYIILRHMDTLPAVLSDALRQWFEIVGRIDT